MRNPFRDDPDDQLDDLFLRADTELRGELRRSVDHDLRVLSITGFSSKKTLVPMRAVFDRLVFTLHSMIPPVRRTSARAGVGSALDHALDVIRAARRPVTGMPPLLFSHKRRDFRSTLEHLARGLAVGELERESALGMLRPHQGRGATGRLSRLRGMAATVVMATGVLSSLLVMTAAGGTSTTGWLVFVVGFSGPPLLIFGRFFDDLKIARDCFAVAKVVRELFDDSDDRASAGVR